jgi:predicted secreted protein
MTLAFALSMYLVIWWVVLFAILPIGVHTQSDDGNIVPGTAESAPHNPHLLPKLLGTTVVASIVFAALYLVIVDRLVTLDDIPFLPRYDAVQQAPASTN